MAPATGTALLVLGLFVLPGFIALVIRERTYTVRGADTPFERTLGALFYSALIYGLALTAAWVLGLDKQDLVDFYRGEKTLGEDLLAAAVVFLLMPVSIAEAGRRWRKSRVRLRILSSRSMQVSTAHGVHSAWNEMFSQPSGAVLLRVTLSDGRVVGGSYALRSFAGYSEHAHDLLISQRWEMDEDSWFVRPAATSTGLWLSRDSIVSVERYEVPG